MRTAWHVSGYFYEKLNNEIIRVWKNGYRAGLSKDEESL